MFRKNTMNATRTWNEAADPRNEIRRYRYGYDVNPEPPLYRTFPGKNVNGPVVLLMLHSAVGEHATLANPLSQVRRRGAS